MLNDNQILLLNEKILHLKSQKLDQYPALLPQAQREISSTVDSFTLLQLLTYQLPSSLLQASSELQSSSDVSHKKTLCPILYQPLYTDNTVIYITILEGNPYIRMLSIQAYNKIPYSTHSNGYDDDSDDKTDHPSYKQCPISKLPIKSATLLRMMVMLLTTP